MYIAEITERLLEVNRLLLKYIKDTELTFEENLFFPDSIMTTKT